jgi:hypothetical protein
VCDDLKEINVSVIKIQNAIRFVRSSPSKQLAFTKCMKSLFLDFATRWNLTYLILEVAENFDKVFVRLGESEPGYMSYFLEVHSKGDKKRAT